MTNILVTFSYMVILVTFFLIMIAGPGIIRKTKSGNHSQMFYSLGKRR